MKHHAPNSNPEHSKGFVRGMRRKPWAFPLKKQFSRQTIPETKCNWSAGVPKQVLPSCPNSGSTNICPSIPQNPGPLLKGGTVPQAWYATFGSIHISPMFGNSILMFVTWRPHVWCSTSQILPIKYNSNPIEINRVRKTKQLLQTLSHLLLAFTSCAWETQFLAPWLSYGFDWEYTGILTTTSIAHSS